MSEIPNHNDDNSSNPEMGSSNRVPEEFVHSFKTGIIRKSEYFDLFISYKRDNGGDHGQKLAIELHRKLTEDGFKVWLDNEEIGFSNNFEQRIEEAILHSKKVACILSPEWVESPNCRFEVKKAIEFEKRIIPIHYQEFRVLLKSKMLAGELTEDEWHRIDKPQEVDFSSTADKRIAYEDLKAVCRLHDDMTAEHNQVLCESFYWNNYDRPKSMLLIGSTLSKSKLVRAKCNNDPELPSFTPLQNEFIEASVEYVSKEVSHKRKVYLAYAEEEYYYARELNFELKLNGVTTWFVRKKTEEKEGNFVEAIVNCESVLDVLVEGVPKVDDGRIAFARANSKRIIQVTKSTEILDKKREAGEKNVFLWYAETRIDTLISYINGDEVYHAAHAKLLEQSFEWEKSEKSNGKLLGRSEAREAKEWYQTAEKLGNEPQPNLSMVNFVERSVAYAEAIYKRRIILTWTAIIGSLLIIGLGIGVWYLYEQSEAIEEIAQESIDDAQKQRNEARDAIISARELTDSLELEAEALKNEVGKAELAANAAKKKAAIAESLAAAETSKALVAKEQASKMERSAQIAQDSAAVARVRAATAMALAAEADENLKEAEEMLETLEFRTNAARLALRAQELTMDGSYDAALENAENAVAFYKSGNLSLETDILYNSYYSILTSRDTIDGKNPALAQYIYTDESTGNVIARNSCQYVNGKFFDTTRALAIYPDIENIYCMTVGPSNNLVAVGLRSGDVIIYDEANKRRVDSISVGRYRISSLAFQPQGTQLVASSIDEKLILIHLNEHGHRDTSSQIIRRETFARIEEVEFIDPETIRAVQGPIPGDENEPVKKRFRYYPATVNKLRELLNE